MGTNNRASDSDGEAYIRNTRRGIGMNFDNAEKIAAAILYEGYILYPYRPTAIKNRQRWNFGTLYPHVYADAQNPRETFYLQAECILIADEDAAIDIRISFLQLVSQDRTLKSRGNQTGSITLAALTDPTLAWEEAVEHTSEHPQLFLRELLDHPQQLTLHLGAEGSAATQANLQALFTIAPELLASGAASLHLKLENVTPLPSGTTANRE